MLGAPSRLTPWSTANRIAAGGSPSSLLRLCPGRARNVANAPLRRVGLPADVASAILFLASNLSSYVTGQTLVVDGGVSAKFPFPSGA